MKIQAFTIQYSPYPTTTIKGIFARSNVSLTVHPKQYYQPYLTLKAQTLFVLKFKKCPRAVGKEFVVSFNLHSGKNMVLLFSESMSRWFGELVAL